MQLTTDGSALPHNGDGVTRVRIRAIVAGDVLLYREGLAKLLQDTATIDVLAIPGRCEDAVIAIDRFAPDVVLLDSMMSGALTLARDIHERRPLVRVIMFAIAEADEDVLACAEAGVAGYVSRTASAEDLIDTVQSVARGELRCSPRIAATLFHRIAQLTAASRHVAHAHLTGREREIIAMLDSGLSNKEIARRLCIRTATVKNHVHHILSKLQVNRRGEAAARIRQSTMRHKV